MDYMKLKMKSCLVCKEKLDGNDRQFLLPGGTICMRCEFAEITVFKVTIPGEKNGYYDTDIGILGEMLSECEPGEGYTIIKERMRALKYYNLPEFTGF